MFIDLSTFYMLTGLLISAYAVIANDSIQTLGTFLASNQRIKWWILASAVSIVLILTLLFGWYISGGDISFDRLSDKGIPFPKNFTIWHALAPVALLILTRFGIPVSTTFLVLSVFGTRMFIEKMILKSLLGYITAAIVAFIIWYLIGNYVVKNSKSAGFEGNLKKWVVLQWITTGYLWVVWLMQDMANISVFLPRVLPFSYLIFIMIILTSIIFYIFSRKGGKIQEIVTSKTNIQYIKSATLVDFAYASILLLFKEMSNIPMSTTWVFIGLLAGRELGIQAFNGLTKEKLPMLFKDLGKITLGLAISIAIAFLVAFMS